VTTSRVVLPTRLIRPQTIERLFLRFLRLPPYTNYRVNGRKKGSRKRKISLEALELAESRAGIDGAGGLGHAGQKVGY